VCVCVFPSCVRTLQSCLMTRLTIQERKQCSGRNSAPRIARKPYGLIHDRASVFSTLARVQNEKTVGRNVGREIFRLTQRSWCFATHCSFGQCKALLLLVLLRPPSQDFAAHCCAGQICAGCALLRVAGGGFYFSVGEEWRLQYLGALGARQRSEVLAIRYLPATSAVRNCIRTTWEEWQGAARVTHYCAN